MLQLDEKIRDEINKAVSLLLKDEQTIAHSAHILNMTSVINYLSSLEPVAECKTDSKVKK